MDLRKLEKIVLFKNSKLMIILTIKYKITKLIKWKKLMTLDYICLYSI